MPHNSQVVMSSLHLCSISVVVVVEVDEVEDGANEVGGDKEEEGVEGAVVLIFNFFVKQKLQVGFHL